MEQNRNGKTKYLMLHWILILIWISCIFSFSAQPARNSNGLSLKVTKVIITAAAFVMPIQRDAGTIERLAVKYNGRVRKIAHSMIYFLLGLLLTRTLKLSGIKGKKIYFFALLFSLAYAVSDELHQVFVAAGRSGQISDVLLDTAGATMGIGIYWLFSGNRNKELL
ncbi:VanZ family protein [Sporomusa acidovorans]|uniref:VanZ-like domain-containing protein n=1 Tax=Sporomusa acidovorans (strain ATCC 49682 / DSM 3132 / Mol) TaxID=1123286 RepID=A0ABZ3J7I3_SPOA4|nr:VanZ family protein [Sporomusa acidovorans]OZC19365.1 VanZ like family protein [Sporomusa acidovorans DSM 3132]SDD79328.1 VanZ like family protein [Sporomusa acidovorans]